jgi:hypothetical protein
MGREGTAVSEVERTPRKAEAAVALRLAGATYDEIAQALGYVSGASALTAVEKVLAGQATGEDQGRMRTIASMRYERLIRAVWTKATNPEHPEQLAAVRAARELIDRHVALNGLALPSQVIVHTPSTQELQRWVAEVSRLTMPEVQEPDIFDAELTDDDEGATG